MGNWTLLNYKFYYREDDLNYKNYGLKIQYFRTLKQIEEFMFKNKHPIQPIQINKRVKGFKDYYALYKKYENE
jgi:hypothetical protein